jgi:hypothetical protein
MTTEQPVWMMSRIETSRGLASNHMWWARSADPKLVVNMARIECRDNPCRKFHDIQIVFDHLLLGRIPDGLLALARQSLRRHPAVLPVTQLCRDRGRPVALSGLADRQIRPQHRHTFSCEVLLLAAGDCLRPNQARLVPQVASDTA